MQNLVIVLLALGACGGSKKQPEPPAPEPEPAPVATTEPAPAPTPTPAPEPAPPPAPPPPPPEPPRDPMGACAAATKADPKAPFATKTKVGAAKVEPKASKGAVQGVVTKNLNRFECCFREQLLAKTDLQKAGKAGTMTAELTIGMDGKVTDARADGVDSDASACVGAVLKSLEFKAGKAEVKATVPFDYTVTAKKGAKAAAAPEAKGDAKAEKTP